MAKTVTLEPTVQKIVLNKGQKGDPGDIDQPFDYVLMNSSGGAVPDQEAAFVWNPTDQTLDINNGNITLQVGQEVVIKAINKTGAQLDNGTAVILNGAQGNRPKIEKADPTTATADSFIGLTTQDIADNAEGFLTVIGKVRSLNTNAFPVGNVIWVDPSTPGALTDTEPTTGRKLRVGVCVVQSINNGEILVATNVSDFTAEQETALLALIA